MTTDQIRMRFLTVGLLLTLLVWMWGCDVFGYHNIGHFPSRQAAHQKALEHLLGRYYLIAVLSDEYRIVYQYQEGGKLIWEGMWYFEDEDKLGLENDVHSGPSKLWTGIARPELKKLIAHSQQGIAVDSALGRPLLNN